MLYTKLLNSGRKPIGIRAVHSTLHQALERAVQWQVLPRNPARYVELPRVENAEIHVWSAQELATFLGAAKGDRYYIVYALAAMTGMRDGEVLGLRWEDVERDKVIVRHSMRRGLLGPTKTGKTRVVTLPSLAIDALRLQHKLQAQDKLKAGQAYQDTGFVATTELGLPAPYQTVLEHWYRLQKLADVPRIRIHDLRHTHATLLLQAGVHPRVVADRLGHSHTSITLDVYSHVTPTMQKEVAEIVDHFIVTKL